MMKNIVTVKEKELSEIELISEYQKTLSGNILAYMYVSNFGAILTIANNYPQFDDADKASFCLQELDKCLRNFDLNSNNKFITYFFVCYKNRLRGELSLLLTQKRRLNLNFKSEPEENLVSDNNIAFNDIDMILSEYNLNEKEKKHCKLLNAGYTIKEISKKFNITVQGVYFNNNRIKQKILNSL